jgi:protein-S-isoprenylcysteine O-methyltransferase Ste14
MNVLPPKGLLIALAAQMPLLLASSIHPSPPELIGGAVVVSVGAALNIWSDRLFRRNRVGVCPFTHVPLIVDRGPYRMTRNPMYVGLVAVNVGVALMTGVLANIWSSVAYFIWLHYAFVLPEEAFLQREIGPAFDSYARRVPRWFFGSTARRRPDQP